jgi:hypothetical protein
VDDGSAIDNLFGLALLLPCVRLAVTRNESTRDERMHVVLATRKARKYPSVLALRVRVERRATDLLRRLLSLHSVELMT